MIMISMPKCWSVPGKAVLTSFSLKKGATFQVQTNGNQAMILAVIMVWIA